MGETKEAKVSPELFLSLIDPWIQRWAASQGAVWPGFGQGNIIDRIQERQYQNAMWSAMQQAAQADRPAQEDFLRGLLALSGREWTPETQTWAQDISGKLGSVRKGV